MHLSAKMHFALYINTSNGSAHSKLSIWVRYRTRLVALPACKL